MKISVVGSNKVYAGEPKEIVGKLAEDSVFLDTAAENFSKPKSPTSYMLSVKRRVEGTNLEECCKNFIQDLIKSGVIKIEE
ncbi:MAG: hypothetical protein AAB851_02595 [Patescibacteria group bacterium]